MQSLVIIDIEFEKIEYLRENLKDNFLGAGILTTVNTINSKYVPELYNEKLFKLIKLISDNYINLIIDETTDSIGRRVVCCIVSIHLVLRSSQ